MAEPPKTTIRAKTRMSVRVTVSCQVIWYGLYTRSRSHCMRIILLDGALVHAMFDNSSPAYEPNSTDCEDCLPFPHIQIQPNGEFSRRRHRLDLGWLSGCSLPQKLKNELAVRALLTTLA